MLAGEPPFTGPTTPAIVARQLVDPVPSIRTVRPTVPEEMERAIEKALAKVPADRFSTTTEFIQGLTTPVAPEVVRFASDRRRTLRRRIVVGLVGIVTVAVLTILVVPGLVLPWGNHAADLGSLAVLPCANRMGDQERDYISAGIHDEVVAGLSRIAAVEVRGRRSVMRYRDTDMSPPEIAGELGVGGLVECSVYRVGNDSVRVNASLLDAKQDRQLWSDTYQRAAAEVFLLGSDVALGVVEALRADVTPAESARVGAHPTGSQEALTHYQRGRYFTSQWTEEGIRKGVEHFEQAIALDSNFALAYSGLAEAILNMGELVALPADSRPTDNLPRARALVLKALELDNELADAHRKLGWIKWVYDYDYDTAESEALLATELDPTSAAAWQSYGQILSVMGRDEEAVGALQRAIELDPVDPTILSDFSLILLMARRYREALDAANTAIELDPDFWPGYSNAAEASFLLGNHDDGIGLYEQARALEDSPWNQGALGTLHGFAGNREQTLMILEELLEMRSRRYVSPSVFANVYMSLDSLDAAIDWLIRAAEIRDPGVNLWQIRSQFFDGLRDHRRYPELLSVLRLEPSGSGR
jgi:TolB-like protein